MYDRQLRAVIAIAETGSMSRAAAQMYVSVPALKKQMDTLEAELGVRLFVRSNQGVVFTPAGEAFCACAKEAVGILDRGMLKARAIQERDRGTIHIGYDNDLVTDKIIYYVLSEWRRLESNINITLEKCQGFDSNKYDLFLGANYQQGHEVIIHELCELPLICILPRNHPLVGKRTITPDELAKFSALLPPREMLEIGAPSFLEIMEHSQAPSFLNLKENYRKYIWESIATNKIIVMIGFEEHVHENLVQIPLEGHAFRYRIYSDPAKEKPSLHAFIDFLKDYYPKKCAEMRAALGLNA